MTSGIYQIVNLKNGKLYLGSSNNIAVRKYNHYYHLRHNTHHSIVLQRAWNKYGEKNFDFSLVLTCPDEMLLFYEQQLLDLCKPEYNISTDAAAPTRGMKLSEETKKKMSRSAIGHPGYLTHHSDETKQKISLSMKGRKMTDEQRLAVSERMKGNTNGYRRKS
jgi:group I intron endonuclease